MDVLNFCIFEMVELFGIGSLGGTIKGAPAPVTVVAMGKVIGPLDGLYIGVGGCFFSSESFVT